MACYEPRQEIEVPRQVTPVCLKLPADWTAVCLGYATAAGRIEKNDPAPGQHINKGTSKTLGRINFRAGAGQLDQLLAVQRGITSHDNKDV